MVDDHSHIVRIRCAICRKPIGNLANNVIVTQGLPAKRQPNAIAGSVRLALQLLLADPEAWRVWPETASRRYDGESDGPSVDV